MSEEKRAKAVREAVEDVRLGFDRHPLTTPDYRFKLNRILNRFNGLYWEALDEFPEDFKPFADIHEYPEEIQKEILEGDTVSRKSFLPTMEGNELYDSICHNFRHIAVVQQKGCNQLEVVLSELVLSEQFKHSYMQSHVEIAQHLSLATDFLSDLLMAAFDNTWDSKLVTPARIARSFQYSEYYNIFLNALYYKAYYEKGHIK